MIVGFKTCVDGSYYFNDANKSEQKATLSAPISSIATALGPNIVPVPIDPTIAAAKQKMADRIQRNVGPGEQIFAIEYRVVDHKWYKVGPTLNSTVTHTKKHALYDKGASFSMEDDESEEEVGGGFVLNETSMSAKDFQGAEFFNMFCMHW